MRKGIGEKKTLRFGWNREDCKIKKTVIFANGVMYTPANSANHTTQVCIYTW